MKTNYFNEPIFDNYPYKMRQVDSLRRGDCERAFNALRDGHQVGSRLTDGWTVSLDGTYIPTLSLLIKAHLSRDENLNGTCEFIHAYLIDKDCKTYMRVAAVPYCGTMHQIKNRLKNCLNYFFTFKPTGEQVTVRQALFLMYRKSKTIRAMQEAFPDNLHPKQGGMRNDC